VSIALELTREDARYAPFVHRFGQHFAIVTHVLQRSGGGGAGLWSEDGQFYFDLIRHGESQQPLAIYSMVGLVPLFAAAIADSTTARSLPMVTRYVAGVLENRPQLRALIPGFVEPAANGARLLAVVDRDRLTHVLERVLDE